MREKLKKTKKETKDFENVNFTKEILNTEEDWNKQKILQRKDFY